MVAIRDPRTPGASSTDPTWRYADNYRPGPSLLDVLGGRATLQRGDSGDAVRELQRLLNTLGVQPPLAEDGLFGAKTQAAVRELQGRVHAVPTGAVSNDLWAGLEVERALSGLGRREESPVRPRGVEARAPRFGAERPAGSLQAGQLARDDETRRQRRTPAAPSAAQPGAPGTPELPARVEVGAVRPAAGQTPADAELEALQRNTVSSAQRELAAGVHDDGANRGTRVDQYARDGGMPVGGAWCGYFTGFNYNTAAREAGGRFTENTRFHSFQKARAYFEYRSYTNNSSTENQRLDRLREQQVGEGSTRRWMVLSGSTGEQHAQANHRPYERYEPLTLPIRAGDTALFNRGHVGLVESYDANSGRLVTIEGNSQGGRVNRNTYDLNDPAVRARFEGFGRPARGDFQLPTAPGAAQPAAEGGAPAEQPAGPAGAPTATPADVRPAAGPTSTAPASTATLALPARPEGAMTGSQFLASTRNMSRAEREQAILREIENGNVPELARQLRDVEVSSTDAQGQRHTGTIHVMPDYLAIGSNEDFVRIPMDAVTAQRIADRTGTSLPTRRIVDEVYRAADVKLTPQPLPPGAQMMSSAYYERHNGMVEDQRRQRGAELGALTAGHQKDLVISNQLTQHPDRVAIYGWHQPNGRPIQPLSTIDEATYADYSHGVRLVGGTMTVDGRERPIAEVLRDPALAGLVSDEGVIRDPRVPRT